MLAALLLSSAASASTIDITMVGTVSTPLTSNTGATWQTLDGQSLPYSVLQGDDATATVIIDTSIEGGSSQVTADGVWFYNDIHRPTIAFDGFGTFGDQYGSSEVFLGYDGSVLVT
jgi:hypothetical protein